jgi:Rps23 Pro-64 3,4-dihydroxylase Tpa1-like proline 4-hydroxylase
VPTLSRLRRKPGGPVQCRQAQLPQAVPSELASSLGSSFGSYPLTECEEHEREKSYQFATAGLSDVDAPEPPDEEWRAFLEVVRAASYRDAISELMGVSLRQAKTTLSLWEYHAGNWLAPHLDKREKLVTQIFYLTSEWREGDGGRL